MSFRHWQVGERDAFLDLLTLRTAWNKVKPSKQREVVIQTTGGLRSQIRDREITQRLVNCSKLPQLLGHNKEKQSPWGRGPCHQRAAGNKADLFCRAGSPEDTAWETETPGLSLLLLYSASQWPNTARSESGKERLQGQPLYLEQNQRRIRRPSRPWKICAI